VGGAIHRESIGRSIVGQAGFAFDAEEPRAAVISACGLYRYTLTRRWDGLGGLINWIMLNPSTADASLDDPTIRRCVGFSKGWGYGAMVVTNLFAYRSTDPKAMKAAGDPVGPENDSYVMEWARASARVVLAYGAHGGHRARDREVIRALDAAGVELFALGTTAAGHPVHPLYQPGAAVPVPYSHRLAGKAVGR
jgi:hypothetical protein